jgi:ParB family chromosome partitioning protein
VLALLESGRLSAGHGRALLQAHDPADLAATVLARGLSVRETEWLAQTPDAVAGGRRPPVAKNADLKALEKELTDFLGLKVEIRHGGEGRGELRINYRSLEQLDVICRKMRS